MFACGNILEINRKKFPNIPYSCKNFEPLLKMIEILNE